MKQKCKICGANSESEYCFQHKPRKALKKSRYTTSSMIEKMRDYQYSYMDTMSKINNLLEKEGKNDIYERNEFFLKIWKKRPHKSEISGEPLGKEPLSVFFHHILSKEKYPEACLDEENIILLTLIEHDNVERDMYKYEEVNKRREMLKEKYNLI